MNIGSGRVEGFAHPGASWDSAPRFRVPAPKDRAPSVRTTSNSKATLFYFVDSTSAELIPEIQTFSLRKGVEQSLAPAVAAAAMRESYFALREKHSSARSTHATALSLFTITEPSSRIGKTIWKLGRASVILSPWWKELSDDSSKFTTRLIASFAPRGHCGSG